MANEKKKQQVAEFSSDIKDKAMIFINYEGINVEDITDVRTKLRENGGKLKIIKNTLLKIALKENNITPEDDFFKSMLAVAILEDETFSSSGKVLLDAEKKEKLAIKGGYYEGNVVDIDYVKKMASIPTKEILYSMLVTSLQWPLTCLASSLEQVAETKQTEEK